MTETQTHPVLHPFRDRDQSCKAAQSKRWLRSIDVLHAESRPELLNMRFVKMDVPSCRLRATQALRRQVRTWLMSCRNSG